MQEINVKQIPEQVIPATYDISFKVDQQQLDWLVGFLGDISGPCTTPLRVVTDQLYDYLKPFKKEKVVIECFHYIGEPSPVYKG